MAQKTIIIDDLDGSEDARTVEFYDLAGQTWEIDLTDTNAETLRKTIGDVLAPYIEVARPKSGRRGASASRKSTSAKSSRGGVETTKEDREAIREWSRTEEAKALGIKPLGKRGQIPEATVTAWLGR